MHRVLRQLCAGVVASLLLESNLAHSAEPPIEQAAEEVVIRAAVEAYVEAFNRGDAKAIAALWSETGEWIAGDGRRVRGRAEIEALMAKSFAAAPGTKLRLDKPTIRFVTPDVAVEEGTALIGSTDGSSEVSTYTAMHVKRHGRWQLESIRETTLAVNATAVSDSSPLEALSWMVGQWVDQSPEAVVETKVEWTMNRRFLVAHFQAAFPGMEPLVGAQVIGYDAAAGSIRSWMFDADGTIGEGVWTHDGKQWLVKSIQVLDDGRRAASTNVYSPRDANSYAWKSIGRKVGDEFLPNIEEVVVVRAGAKATADVEIKTTGKSEEAAP